MKEVMAVSTVGEYLSALEKSKLLNSEQLVEAQRLAGELPDAAELAKALARKTLVSRWQASVLLDRGPRAQLHLGKYKLIQPLGKGGMGTVFLAEHVTMNRRVALKIVPRSIAKNRASLDRFFAEARAIAALDHPNIVQAYSVDNEMDRYFIVMEYVDGQDLQRFVELNGPLDFASAADYIRQAAEGLAHAHARNLVHCDIKPSNLLVNNQGVIKILDLGLVRLNRSDEPRRSATGEPAFGTVDYMAPEQAMETTNFDHRADIYSLGCTLYFLLAGHPPFAEGTLAQRIVRHQTQEPRDILLERPNTPPKLVEICKRM
ncbi:MAG: serine/threonine-protein kinase, partial [Thermoguttaceae bacterium]